jgi:hypothetical protein
MKPALRFVGSWAKWICLSILDEGWRALLSFGFGLLGVYTALAYSDVLSNKSFIIQLSDAGIGYPGLLFKEAERENPELAIVFAPEPFERLAVCEFYADRQQTFRVILDKYLERYSECFIPIWRGENQLEVRPNTYTGELLTTTDVEGGTHYWCKCAQSQIPLSPMKAP